MGMGVGCLGRLIIIVAPSGAGKTTLIQRLKKDFPFLLESVSYTTRPMRKGEKEGVHYYFISEEEFEEKLKAKAFLEWEKIHAHSYGTEKRLVEEAIEKGEIVLFDLDTKGCDSLRRKYPHCSNIIFIEPPSLAALEERLRGRNTETDDVLSLRIANAKAELARKNDYDYLVLNDDLERAYGEIVNIVQEIVETCNS